VRIVSVADHRAQLVVEDLCADPGNAGVII
jgi:hypothetical protein